MPSTRAARTTRLADPSRATRPIRPTGSTGPNRRPRQSRVSRRAQHPAPTWGRTKMLALLAAAAGTLLLLAAGLVLAVVFALHPLHARTDGDAPHSAGVTRAGGGASGGRGSGGSSAQRAEDALAARPMPTVGPDAYQPATVSTADPGPVIVLPAATGSTIAGVATGFPDTPAGAMAQLAAIDQAALQSGSLAGARAVIGSWAAVGGPTPSSWSGVAAVAALLNAATLPGGGDPQLAVVVTPVMGLVKGTVGPDFVVPCIDFEVDVTVAQTSRAADADCQRMSWIPAGSDPTGSSTAAAGPNSKMQAGPTADGAGAGRWVIGAGAEPATPPSVWPDTDLAIAVGYRDLRTEPTHD